MANALYALCNLVKRYLVSTKTALGRVAVPVYTSQSSWASNLPISKRSWIINVSARANSTRIMTRLSYTTVLAIVAACLLPDLAQAQSGLFSWAENSWPSRTESAGLLEPNLNFPTEESTEIRQVAFEQPVKGEHAEGQLRHFVSEEPAWSDQDFEAYPMLDSSSAASVSLPAYEWSVLPEGLIYKSYMAGVKESRLSAHLINIDGDSEIFDGNLGGRFGVIRWGRDSTFLAEGIQWDVEGSAHVRLDIPEDVDVRSVDFRAGTQLTWSYAANPALRARFGYYHLSSHLGDEFVLKNPGFRRLNYARDVIILGHSYYLSPKLRVYGEVGWAFYHLIADPWEFQFGLEWAPTEKTGPWGEPFFAINGHLREEVNYGGNLTVQTGWAWVGDVPGRTLRLGLHYFNGESSQYSFFDDFEHQIGFGLWYDF